MRCRTQLNHRFVDAFALWIAVLLEVLSLFLENGDVSTSPILLERVPKRIEQIC